MNVEKEAKAANTIQLMFKQQFFLKMINRAFYEYNLHGARSSKKVDFIHTYLAKEITNVFNDNNYKTKLECKIPSYNASSNKQCDITLFYNDNALAIFPVKFIMSNYLQNKNNYWEALTGEVIHLRWANPTLLIYPINIMFSSVPYLKRNKIITRYENISYIQHFSHYMKLVEMNYVNDMIIYIIDVKHKCELETPYNICPDFIGFNKYTKYK